MAEYIEKEALLKELEKAVESADDWKTAHEIFNAVKYYVQETKQASWVTDSDGLFICSECEEPAPQRMMFHPEPFYWTCEVQLTNFCPNCGAELIPEKLRGKK